MRIRKCAARLLGTLPACSPSPLHAAARLTTSWPPSLTRSWDSRASSSSAAAGGLLCEVNRSPWDDLMCLELVAPCQPEEEEDGGILGNGVKVEVGEPRGITGNRIKDEADAVVKSEASMNWSDDKVEKETAKTRRKKKDDVTKAKGRAAVMEASASCKKSDGKGWHCKRRAQHPHSLCNYHLNQLRSYSCSKAAEPAKEGHGGGVSSGKKNTDTAGAGSNFYYYYYGFGPWRGKTRGGSSDNGDQCSRRAADEEDEREILEPGNWYDVDAPVAGEDDDEGGEDDGNGGVRDDDDNNGRDGNDNDNDAREGSKRRYKKRGRKRMKARSLKSLL